MTGKRGSRARAGRRSKHRRQCGTLTLTSATTPDARAIEVEYTVDSLWSPRDVVFRVYRSARNQPDNGPPVAEKTVKIPAGPADTPKKLRIIESVDLTPDPNKPYVIVIAEQSRHVSSTWFQKHLVGVLVHGYTFRKAYEVARFLNADAGLKMADWLFKNEDVEPWQAILESTLEAACYSPATFAFNWRHASIQAVGSELTRQARDRLYPRIISTVSGLVRTHTAMWWTCT